MKAIKINSQFEDLQKPETFINHVQEITKTTATPHAEILSRLLEQFEPLDFEAMANPHTTVGAYAKTTILFTYSMVLTGMNSIKKHSKSF